MTSVETPLRVGFVGLGGMGHVHANNVVELGHEVVGGVDVDEQSRDRFADRFDAPVFESYERMDEMAAPDAVVVATPNAFHAPAAVAALERDVPVLTEKPLAANLDAAQEIAEAADESWAFVMVGFHNRFTPAMSFFETYREEGYFGDIVHVETKYMRRRGVPNVDSWFTDRSLAGGGALIDIGVHAIDFAMAVAGFPDPIEVSGVTRRLWADRDDYADPQGWGSNDKMAGGAIDVDDGATALLRCENDCTIAIDVAWANDREQSRTVSIQGMEAGARCDLGGGDIELLSARSDGKDHFVDTSLSHDVEVDPKIEEMTYFLDCIAADRPPQRNTVSQALTVQHIIHGIYQSSATKQAYRFDEPDE